MGDNNDMSTSQVPFDILKTTARFQAVLQSIAKFDELEVKGVVRTLLATTDQDKGFIATYHRASANVATLLELKHPMHFQAINMLARTMFELAVDIRLINAIPNGSEKMLAFVDVEKLRCARKILKFHATRPITKTDPKVYAEYVASEAKRIDAQQNALWPGPKPPKHWSGMTLPDRIAKLKAPFDELYEVTYPHLSWQVHSGLTGVVNLNAETFTTMCGYAFILAADSYREILSCMIEEFKIEKADRKIKEKLKVARVLPFTDSPEEVDRVLDALTD
jgi:hypothetical protein